MSRLRERAAMANRGHGILERATLLDVHVNVSRRYERYVRDRTQMAQRFQPFRIVGASMKFDRDPRAIRESCAEPVAL